MAAHHDDGSARRRVHEPGSGHRSDGEHHDGGDRGGLDPAHVADVLHHAGDAVVTVDRDSRVVYVNRAAERLFGWTAADLLGGPLDPLLPDHGDAGHAAHAASVADYAAGGVSARSMGEGMEVRGRRRDGREFPAWVMISRADTDGGPLCTAVVRDVSEQRRLEARVRERDRFSRAVLNALPDPTAAIDRDGRVTDVNPAWRRPADGVRLPAVGASVRVVAYTVSGAHGAEIVRRVDEALDRGPDGDRVHAEPLTAPVDGTGRVVDVAVEPFDGGALIVLRDVTERERTARELRRRAELDDLTGLVRRGAALEAVDRHLAGGGVAVVLVDLDGFKDINDRHGHDVGDRVLAAVARRVRDLTPPDGVAGRVGGDEFVVVLPRADARRARAVADRMVAAAAIPVDDGQRTVRVGASAGIVVADGDDGDSGAGADRLVADADDAMYQAKAAGRGRVVVSDEQDRRLARERRRTQRRLAGVADRGELRLECQPLVDAGRAVVGVEALVRWDDPTAGVVRGPGEFVPLAEDSGAVVEIGAWVLDQACAHASRWLRDGILPPGRGAVAVNMSAVELRDPATLTRLLDAAARHGLRPSDLTVEVTEGMLLDCDDVVAATAAFHQAGVRVALDDFGTGYASLSALRRLPIDTLKIDRSLVAEVCEDDRAVAVLASTVELARRLDVRTVAEGVESAAQARALTDVGCEQQQGYFHAAPMPPEDVAAWVRRTREESSTSPRRLVCSEAVRAAVGQPAT